jgi:protein-S-isoprenylcysteine O-methyltransferase Ste14
VTIRVLGASWFLILALPGALKVGALASSTSLAEFSSDGWPALLSSLCLSLFYLALFWLVLHRPSPTARTVGILPSITAFAATYLPWTIVLLAPGAATVRQNVASSALLLSGGVSMVFVICHLGRNFSIVPQARRLVRAGPYAVVRHPLYLAEEVALLGVLVEFFSPLALAIFLTHGVLQIWRMLFEERLLRRTFPDFEDYARSTPRLIPYVW